MKFKSGKEFFAILKSHTYQNGSNAEICGIYNTKEEAEEDLKNIVNEDYEHLKLNWDAENEGYETLEDWLNCCFVGKSLWKYDEGDDMVEYYIRRTTLWEKVEERN